MSKLKDIISEAEKGNVAAQKDLAFLYEVGFQMESNKKLALEWWKKAADQGDKEAVEKVQELIQEHEEVTEAISKESIDHEMTVDKSSHLEIASKPSVLIIDDDPDICQVVKDSCPIEGVNIHMAYDATEGLEKIENNPIFHLIFLDIRMPGADGIQFLKAIKGNHSLQNIPVIIISGFPTKEYTRYARMLGAEGWIEKPFGMSEIEEPYKKFLKVPKNPE